MFKIVKSRFSLSHRRDIQFRKVLEENVEMRSCFKCTNNDIVCVAHRSSDRCVECIRLIKFCDLIVIVANWDKLDSKRESVRKKIAKRRKLIAETSRIIAQTFIELFKLKNVQKKLRIKTFEMIAREIKFFDEKNEIVFVKFIFVDFDFNDSELLVFFDESFSLLNFVDDIDLQKLDNVSNCF
jgi:hypothetical protein